jgi:hypothetical protein
MSLDKTPCSPFPNWVATLRPPQVLRRRLFGATFIDVLTVSMTKSGWMTIWLWTFGRYTYCRWLRWVPDRRFFDIIRGCLDGSKSWCLLCARWCWLFARRFIFSVSSQIRTALSSFHIAFCGASRTGGLGNFCNSQIVRKLSSKLTWGIINSQLLCSWVPSCLPNGDYSSIVLAALLWVLGPEHSRNDLKNPSHKAL